METITKIFQKIKKIFVRKDEYSDWFIIRNPKINIPVTARFNYTKGIFELSFLPTDKYCDDEIIKESEHFLKSRFLNI